MSKEYKFNGDYDSLTEAEKPQANQIAKWLSKIVTPNKIIDIGCGPGLYVYAAQDYGLSAIGYDLDPRVNDKPSLIQKNLFNIKDSADAILCLEVLEHISPKDSQKAVNKIYDTLEKDGILIFSASQVGQGGVDHINNRPKEYWEHKFKEKGLIRCQSLETQLLDDYIWKSRHMGWLVKNLMIFYKIDESIRTSNTGSLVGPQT